MGVTIGAGAVVESYSNVVALTNIGPGEVWGGSPAVLLRRRTDLVPSDAAARSTPPSLSGGEANGLDSDCDSLDRARRVVARALDQPLEAVLSGDWDSLQKLAIALTLEEECGRRPMGDQIFEMQSLSDVARALGDAVASGPTANSAGRRTADPEWLPLLPFSVAATLAMAIRPRCLTAIRFRWSSRPASMSSRWRNRYGNGPGRLASVCRLNFAFQSNHPRIAGPIARFAAIGPV